MFEDLFMQIELWLAGLGPWAWVAAPLVTAVVAVLPVPAEAPAMLNGMLFGAVRGSIVTWTGAMAGALVSFELARAFGRPFALKLLGKETLETADRTVLTAGWGGMLVARFVPLIAFTALNWGAGLTPVSRWRFFWTTAVGIVPGVIVFTSSGTGLAMLFERLSPFAAAVAAVTFVVVLAWAYQRQRSIRSARASSPPEGDPRIRPADGTPSNPTGTT